MFWNSGSHMSGCVSGLNEKTPAEKILALAFRGRGYVEFSVDGMEQ